MEIKQRYLEKVRDLDKETNKILSDFILSLSYFSNPELEDVFTHYNTFVAMNLYKEYNLLGLYVVKNNTIHIDPEFIHLDVFLHEKIHMLTASLKENKIGYQDDKTKETFLFTNYLNESATEWLKCKILYGENFLENNKAKYIISYLPGVIEFQKYINKYGEERMLENFFRHDFRTFWNSFSTEEKANIYMDFENARVKAENNENKKQSNGTK